jgi:hypothetical protein
MGTIHLKNEFLLFVTSQSALMVSSDTFTIVKLMVGKAKLKYPLYTMTDTLTCSN